MKVIIRFQVIFYSFLGDEQKTCGEGGVSGVFPDLTFDMADGFHKDIYCLLLEYLHSRVINPVKPRSKPQDLEDAVIRSQFNRLFNHKIRRCPVCEGRGSVPNGFYSRNQCATTDASPETCKSCNGKGYIQV